ncbi:hypothetical protein SKAU_G00260820 [Synaphobranchus kaupii]|uniref:Uncharacterized protein n=1 Tax=Synaphobranchus kaupii TaxID=118154 RepID=A0A9Q1F4M8_SYNKA|nr:hypothetical protein SKAU_G00260820 [Synaphobranchus kaupii]
MTERTANGRDRTCVTMATRHISTFTSSPVAAEEEGCGNTEEKAPHQTFRRVLAQLSRVLYSGSVGRFAHIGDLVLKWDNTRQLCLACRMSTVRHLLSVSQASDAERALRFTRSETRSVQLRLCVFLRSRASCFGHFHIVFPEHRASPLLSLH